MRDQMLVFGAPQIGEEEIESVVDTLRSGWIGTGPKCKAFERAFAEYKGAEHAVAVNSATAGLHLALATLALAPGDEVITTAMTFCATVNSIIHAGGTPVLADIDPQTWNLDVEDVARRITPRTRALVPVHFAGRACDMDALTALAEKHGLAVIEDCAHAVEGRYRDRPLGMFGDFGVFSFYATKNLVTGEGGMVLCRDAAAAARVRMLSLHGLSRDAWRRFSGDGFQHYYAEDVGYKYNMTDMQAAMGLPQLARLEENRLHRHRLWRYYHDQLAALPIVLPAPVEPHVRHAYHLFQIRVDEDAAGIARDAFCEGMIERKIGVAVHYQALPRHPFFRERYGWRVEDYPRAARFGSETVSLPLSPRVTLEDAADVVAAVSDILNG